LAERFAGALEVEKADIVQAGSVHALRDNLQVRSLDVMFVDAGIAIMTSELGSIAQSGGFWPLYLSSKAALNMLMKGYAARRLDEARALLLVAPGWGRTEMSGEKATL
jgi:NAD(P)-dependent dehydrogenase (short-subunit alcohol dehydrogenase family)